MERRSAMGALMGAMLAGYLPRTGAQSPFPSSPLRWIVPYPAGGGTDVLARTIAEAMKSSFTQNIVVDNRPGGSSNIGVEQLITSRPDGYTVMSADNAALTFNQHLFKKLPYNPERDFTYIAGIGRFPLALVVNPDFPARTMGEFIAYAKANAGKLTYASPGNGTPHHVGMELFKQVTGIELTNVPYRGAAPAMQDLMAGQVPVMLLDLASGLSIIRSGKVRALGVGTAQRARSVPDIPTFAELGIQGADVFAIQGMVGPAGMPAEAAGRLAGEVQKALQHPAVVKRFEDFAVDPLGLVGEEFKRFVRSEANRWGEVIRKANISLD